MRPELLPAEANCAGGGVGFDVADADVPSRNAKLFGDFFALTAEDDFRLTGWLP